MITKQGDKCHIWESAFIDDKGEIELGDNVYIGKEVVIINHDHDLRKDGHWRTEYTNNTLIIGDRAYIGYRAMILPQVKEIGEGAIIGAGSVVTKDVPAWEIWAGNPAKKIRERI